MPPLTSAVALPLNDLNLHLDSAVDAVEAELGLAVEHRASQRIYEPDTPVGFIGDPFYSRPFA